MRRKKWIKTFTRVALYLFVLESNVHAEAVNSENHVMQFSYTTNGAADGSINSYGNNEISVSGDTLLVQIGDSMLDRNRSGVGIYEMKLLNRNLEDAEKLTELLCSPKDPNSDVTLPDLYGVNCGVEVRSSYVSDFNRDVVVKISDLVESLTNAGVHDGRKLVKLDVSLVSIDRDKEGFLVSVRFSNSGDYPIEFKTPDRWDSKIGKDGLGVSDSKGGMSSKFALGLAGQTLVNHAQFPDGEVNLAPHSAVDLKLKTNKVDRFSAGTYDLNVGAFMNIDVSGIQSSLLRVDFHSDYKKPTRITFDRDYPSTPEEREQWEAKHRKDMSWQPVKPGETFAEDGLYRPVRTSGGYRGLNLRHFKAGDVASADSVKMPMENLGGVDINGPVQWVWEATAPTPVKQWSPDMIADTVQHCEPGIECPRSGRWIKRIRSRDWARKDDRYDLASVVTLRRGQRMPASTDDRSNWEWVGAGHV